MNTKPLSAAQYERQTTRERGRYSKLNPCQCCGKGAGAGYWSDSRCDEPGHDPYHFSLVALVLCKKCCEKGDAMPDKEAYEFYTRRSAKKAG